MQKKNLNSIEKSVIYAENTNRISVPARVSFRCNSYYVFAKLEPRPFSPPPPYWFQIFTPRKSKRCESKTHGKRYKHRWIEQQRMRVRVSERERESGKPTHILHVGLVSWHFDRCFHMWYTFEIDFVYDTLIVQIRLHSSSEWCVIHSLVLASNSSRSSSNNGETETSASHTDWSNCNGG